MKDYLSQYQWQHILQPIIQAIGPCKIYLMGVAAQQRTFSVFTHWHYNTSTCPEEISGSPEGCFLLVLIESDGPRTIHCCREKIDYLSDKVLSIDVIAWVMSYSRFSFLLNSDDYFANIVLHNAVLCCDTIPQLSLAAKMPFFTAETFVYRYKESLSFIRKLARAYTKRGYSLMAGMELYIDRKEYALAALLLHQSAEQLLTAIVYARTGYRPQTHHLGRLYEYTCFVCPSLVDIWPLQSDEAYAQFRHLNKAYLEARYGSYEIQETTLHYIAGKLYELQALATAATSIAA